MALPNPRLHLTPRRGGGVGNRSHLPSCTATELVVRFQLKGTFRGAGEPHPLGAFRYAVEEKGV
jgi:hypothetical protein